MHYLKFIPIIISFFFCTQSFGAELYCSGRGWIEPGPGFPDSVLLKFDLKTLKASLTLLRGTAVGELIVKEKIYNGIFTLPNGERMWIILDRYTGQITVMPDPIEDGQTAIFIGDCTEAKPKF